MKKSTWTCKPFIPEQPRSGDRFTPTACPELLSSTNPNPVSGAGSATIFTSLQFVFSMSHNRVPTLTTAKLHVRRGFTGSRNRICTNFGHALVDALHSIENTCTYKRVFFVDGKNRRSTTGLFFDSFLSFSGWCGVRDPSAVTFSPRGEMEGKQGSIAKRWSRRTEKQR